MLEESWQKFLKPELDKPYMQNLRAFLRAEKDKKKIIYPKSQEVFNAFQHTPFDKVKVVILGQDWEELMDMLHLGGIEKLSARFGTYLQIRPKAAHSRILGRHINERAELAFTGPKGFYLRTVVTRKMMAEHYCL